MMSSSNEGMGFVGKASSSSSQALQVRVCSVCSATDSKYRCPACGMRYCSKGCCQKHKDDCVEPDSTTPTLGTGLAEDELNTILEAHKKYKYFFPTEDTVPLEKLVEVKEDGRINEMLKSPRLRRLITEMDETSDPRRLLPIVMEDPEFRKFSNIILQILGFRDDNGNSE